MSAKSTAITQIPEPPFYRFLFADTRLAILWLLLRLYLAYEWISAGWEKITSSAWVGDKSGTALAGFLHGAITKSQGQNPAVQGWYADFIQGFALQHTAMIAHMVGFGEFFVGIALLLGLFTGIAAFFGAFMNMNYLFAGTVSINPLMFLIELFVILAWRVAGWYGADRYLLSLLGTPWQKGKLFSK